MHLAKDPVLAKINENRYQLKIEVIFRKEAGQVQLQPSVEEYLEEIARLIRYNVEELSYVPCFQANEIGNAREDGKVKIFEKQGDVFIEQSIATIVGHFRDLFKIPTAIKDVIAEYGYILATDIKKFKQ